MASNSFIVRVFNAASKFRGAKVKIRRGKKNYVLKFSENLHTLVFISTFPFFIYTQLPACGASRLLCMAIEKLTSLRFKQPLTFDVKTSAFRTSNFAPILRFSASDSFHLSKFF
jgi:hypothetical protein